ncbi:uncharacterized protein LOC112562297 isoform X3 [Pomacea canaliculata]|uniref:uncharacterized protein LOC112562297 isoform X3 n=1 Tax=Pomacea canaliculata TaxID=400727 RepID=UPI000D726610|nr:uncharacterized protein LOC112562297 isoform X3 [Pomacea canaliculata]
MEEIEPFVRRLCNEEDLSVLTKKMVRKRYQSHFKKDSVSPEERQKINEVLDVILEELARGNKILIADGTTEESTVSPEQGKENLCDYQNHTSTNSPATSFRHRIVHKIPRSELEGSLSGPTHLKQIGLPLRREHKKESVLGLSDRHESTQDSGCVSITFTNSADEDSTTDNAEKSVTIPTTEGRVSGRSKGDLQCSPCRHDAALTDVWQETEEEDDVRLVSVSPQVNKCAKGSVSESVQINQPSFQSKIEESGDSGDYVSEGETTRPHNTDSPLTEPKLSVDCVRQHKNQHRKVVNLQSAVAAVTSSDSDSCTEPRSKGLYCVPKKHWRISGLSIKTEPLLPHKLEALGEKSNGKISCNTNSITLLHKKSKDFNKTEHVQSSPEETRGKQFAAKDSDYDASEECSSVFSSPAHVSTSKNWSRAKLTARQAQDILVTELQSGDIPASLSGAQIDSCPQTSNMHPTNMDSGSAFHKVSPLSEASNARSIIDTLLKISKKRRSAEAKSPEKRLRKQAFCNTLQISHPDSNSDDLPLMCIRWQRDQDNYVVASRHNSVRSSNDTLNKKLAPHSNSGSDEKLEPYKTSRNMKVKNVFDTTTSESSAQLSEIYFSPPSSSSKQSAKGRGLGLRVKQSRGGKQLQKPKPQDVSVYSLSGETTEDSSRRIRKHTGKVYKESDPWEVHPYCGESFRQAVIVLEDVSMKRRCKSKQSVKNSLHRKGASTVLKLQNKGLCHNAISNNMHSSDSDLIVEMDSSVYHKSPIVQPQQSPSESRVTAYAPILLPIAQMEGEMEIVLDASRDEEWMNGFGVNFGCELHINCGSLSPKDCSSRNATYEGESAENPLCNGPVTSFEEVVFSLILCRSVLHP